MTGRVIDYMFLEHKTFDGLEEMIQDLVRSKSEPGWEPYGEQITDFEGDGEEIVHLYRQAMIRRAQPATLIIVLPVTTEMDHGEMGRFVEEIGQQLRKALGNG